VRSRLWLRLYLGTVLALAAVFAMGMLFARLAGNDRRHETELWAQRLFAELANNRHDAPALEKSIAWMRDISTISLTLYDAQGTVIASTLPTAPQLEASVRLSVSQSGTSGNGWTGTAMQVPLAGEEPGFGVVTFSSGQNSRFTLWLGANLILLLVISLAFNLHLVRPLRRIADAATRFGKGELDARSAVKRSDEIGDVARAFDDTADRVNRLMAAQRELIANVSHELRTPLARMRVAIDLIADGVTQRAVEVLPEISRDLEELERLLDDVMTLARLDPGRGGDGQPMTPLRRERLEAKELVSRAAERFRALYPERKLDVALNPPAAPLNVDPVLMRRVLDNLIDNARKYSEGESAIEVEVASEAQHAVFTVRDHGIGIERADLEHIFTPFFRTDRSRDRATGGVGLGLVLARRVVEAHGGSIQIESEPGRGSQVKFTVPIAG
jgi:two-component system OmpR family sensor kinase